MAAKKTATKAAATPATKTAAAPAPKPVVIDKALATMSIEAIEAQLQARRDQEVAGLKAQLEKLDTERNTVRERIATLTATLVKRGGGGGGKRGPRGPRAKNEKPLAQYLHDVLKAGGDMTAKQAIEALGKTDWKTNSKDPYVSVFTALTKNGELFEKVSRGVFRAK